PVQPDCCCVSEFSWRKLFFVWPRQEGRSNPSASCKAGLDSDLTRDRCSSTLTSQGLRKNRAETAGNARAHCSRKCVCNARRRLKTSCHVPWGRLTTDASLAHN